MKRWEIVAPRELAFNEMEASRPGPGEVLVEVMTSVVSPGTELYAYREGPNPMMTIPGYLSAGIVREVGEGVSGIATGQRVRIGGPHESMTVAKAANVVPLPDGVGFDVGALVHLASLGHRCLHASNYRAGDDVAVIGLGLVGMCTALVALRSGARVHAIDVVASRIDLARSLGIQAYDATDPDLGDHVTAATLRGVDVVVDTSGSWAGLLTAMQVSRTSTSVSVIGVNRFPPDADISQKLHEEMLTFPARFHYEGTKIVGCSGHPRQDKVAYEDWSAERAYAYLLDEMAAGRLDLTPLIGSRIAPDGLADVMRAFDEGRQSSIGVAIDWSAR